MKEVSTKIMLALVGALLAGASYFLLDVKSDLKEVQRIQKAIAFNQGLIMMSMAIDAGENPFAKKEEVPAPR